jgi:hypothetical protein
LLTQVIKATTAPPKSATREIYTFAWLSFRNALKSNAVTAAMPNRNSTSMRNNIPRAQKGSPWAKKHIFVIDFCIRAITVRYKPLAIDTGADFFGDQISWRVSFLIRTVVGGSIGWVIPCR